MMLQTILYGTFVPPEAPSRIHRIGFAGSDRYVPTSKKEREASSNIRPQDKLAGSKKHIYSLVMKNDKPVTASIIHKQTAMTRNHCSIILAELHKMGLLRRRKTHQNGTYLYLYSLKEKPCP